MATLAKLFVELGLDADNFDSGLDKTAKKSRDWKKGLLVGGAAMSAAFTGPALIAGKALLGVASDYDSLTDTIVAKTGASGDSLKSMQQTALNVFKSIPTSMEAVGSAMTDLQQRTGATGITLEDLTRTQLELARVTGTDVTANIESTTAAFNSWGVAVNDQSAALDVLFTASQNTGVPVATLGDQLAKYGPILRQMGFGLDEATALLGTLGKAGLDAGTVITGMRTAFKGFAKEGITDTGAALQDIFNTIKDSPTSIAAGQLAIEKFGGKAGPALADAIRSGKLEYSDLLDIIENGGDSILETAASTNDLSENWQIFKNRLSVAVLPLANKLFATLNKYGIPALDRLTGLVERLAGWFGKLSPKMKMALGIFGAVLVAIGPIMLAVGGLIGPITTILSGIAFFASPIGLVILGIVALVGGLILLYRHSKAFRGIVQGTIKTLSAFGHYIAAVLKDGDLMNDWLTHIPKPLRGIVMAIGQLVKYIKGLDFKHGALGDLIDIFQALAKGDFRSALREIGNLIGEIGEAIAKKLDAVGLTHFADAIRDTFGNLKSLFTDVVTLIGDIVHGRWAKIWSDLKDIAIDMFWLFIDRFKLAGGLLLDIFNAIPWGTIAGALVDGLVAAWNAIPWDTIAGLVWDGIQFLINNTFLLIPNLIYEAITGKGSGAGALLYDAGRVLISWLWTGIASLWDWILGQVSNLPGAMIKALEWSYNWFYGMGQWLIGGFIQGVLSIAWQLASAVWNAVNDAIQAGKDRLHLGSPSKVFRDMGVLAIEGFVQGINGTAADAQSAVSSALSFDATATVTGTRAATGGGGYTFAAGAIVVNNPQNGEQVVSEILRAIRRVSAGEA